MVREIQRKKTLRKKLLKTLMFLVKFNLLAIPLYIVMWLNLSLPVLQNFLSYAAVTVINSIGYKIDPNNIEITMDCIGWKSMYVLTALVFATAKSDVKNKIKFLLFSLPVVFIINFARIISIILVAISYGLEAGMAVDSFLWSSGMIAVVLIIWYLWLRDKIII